MVLMMLIRLSCKTIKYFKRIIKGASIFFVCVCLHQSFFKCNEYLGVFLTEPTIGLTLKNVSAPRFEGRLLKFGGQFHAVRHLCGLLFCLSLHYCSGFHSNPLPYQIAPVEKEEPVCEAVGESD